MVMERSSREDAQFNPFAGCRLCATSSVGLRRRTNALISGIARERPGYFWHPSRWEQRDGRWYLEKGRWDRQRYARWDERRGPRPYGDRDRDGIPNAADRDRDGDGVPNRRDARPDNPYRQ
jgi:hypothetical protein